jgi:hypothetical protein
MRVGNGKTVTGPLPITDRHGDFGCIIGKQETMGLLSQKPPSCYLLALANKKR